MATLLSQFHQRIGELDGVESARLRAELAMHLCRYGDDVRAELTALRQVNLISGDPLLSIWIHITEGVQGIIGGDSEFAISEWARAKAVALATGADREVSVVEAWLAYYSYTCNELVDVVDRAALVLGAKEKADPLAVARVQMLVGQVLHYCGCYAKARPWYEMTRDAAIRSGDQTLISALSFNIASNHVCNWRHALIRGVENSTSFDLLRIMTESVKSYDELANIRSLRSYELTLMASVDLFKGNYREAYEMFERAAGMMASEGLERMSSLYLSEMSLCAASLGEYHSARSLMSLAQAAVSEKVHLDDRAATHSRLAEVSRLIGEQDIYDELVKLAKTDWERHESFQRRVLLHLQNAFEDL